ncbi:hypothetical protein D6D04_05691 [Aureobasidium pullulans]|nr:hypothetical protein D6D04_05691 [Aureobasidium pullulans]
MRSPIFDEIRDQLISDHNPARDGREMDYERCAALHNAIVKYGWTASGRLLEDLPTTTCWQAAEEGWEQNADRLHPSMIEFLKRAHDTQLTETEPLYNFCSREYKFFYFLDGLVGPHGYEAYNFEHIEGQYMTLYTPNDRLGSHAYGLIYNQETHECIINFTNTRFDPINRVLPWQRLETVLSVYIDMIECEKVVCIHNDVENPGDSRIVHVPGDDEVQWLSTDVRPDAMFADPATGVKRDDDAMFGPWIVQPFTKDMLDKCLQTWEALVDAIEKKMPETLRCDKEFEYGLVDEDMLRTAGITEEFFRQLLLRARKPKFAFIAPGLRMPNSEEFMAQPFRDASAAQSDPEVQSKMPILLFRGNDVCAASQYFPYPYSKAATIPTGVYLEGWTRDDLVPFTDATRLLLPFTIGGNDTWAQTSSGIAIEDGHDELYQIGHNPFVPDHGVSLLAILQNFCAHVETGDWTIDEEGVSDPIEKFREAEIEEHFEKYIVPIGPGEFW